MHSYHGFTSAFLLLLATSSILAEEFITPGSLRGTAMVTSQGSASYTIPIDCPAGTAGMQPNLTLRYDSQSGGGVMGQGWSISGYSQITRGPRNFAVDGYVAGVQFDEDVEGDAVYLDGQRLIEIARTSEFVEYRTEIDSYSRVRRMLGEVGPRFVVHTRADRTLSFGSTENSIPALQYGKSILWLCDRVEDRVGNYLTLTYEHHGERKDGDYDLKRVDYTGNDAAGLKPYASVEFEFEDVPEPESEPPSFSYLHGVRITRTNRLKRVVSKFGSENLMSLEVQYDQAEPGEIDCEIDGNRNDEELPMIGYRVHSIKKYGRDGTTYYRPSTFQYSKSLASGQPAWKSLPDLTLPPEIAEGQYASDGQVGVRYADLNDDGLDDLLYAADQDGTLVSGVWLNGKTRWEKAGSEFPLDVPLTLDGARNEGVLISDINDDGVADFVYGKKDAEVTRLSQQNATTKKWSWVAGPAAPAPMTVGNRRTNHMFVDMNHDGKLDFATGEKAWLFDGIAWQPADSLRLPIDINGAAAHTTLDVSGDGQVELFALDARSGAVSGWQVKPNSNGDLKWTELDIQFVPLSANDTSTGTVPPLRPLSSITKVHKIEAVDLDGDGTEELLVYREHGRNEDDKTVLRIFSLDTTAMQFKERSHNFPVNEFIQNGRPLGFRWCRLNADHHLDLLAYTIVTKPAEGQSAEAIGAFLKCATSDDFDHQWRKDAESDFLPPYPLAVQRLDGQIVQLPVFMPVLTKEKVQSLIYQTKGDLAGFKFSKPLTYLNTGRSWQFSADFVPPEGVKPPGKELAAQMLDVNADGLIDILQSLESDEASIRLEPFAAINTGVGWRPDESYRPPYPIVDGDKHTGAAFVDVNGDALPDMVVHRTGIGDPKRTDVYTFLNLGTGKGWSDDYRNWHSPASLVDDTLESQGTRFIDLNGDGLTDILQSRRGLDGKSEHAAWLNTGSGWEPHDGFAELPPGFGFVCDRLEKELEDPASWEVPVENWDGEWETADGHKRFDARVTLQDLNGDRLPDLCWHFVANVLIKERVNAGGVDVFRITRGDTPHVDKGALINTGSGWEVASALYTPPKHFADLTTKRPVVDHYVQDLNGDGLPDTFYIHFTDDGAGGATNHSQTFLNTGLAWAGTSDDHFSAPDELVMAAAPLGNERGDRGIRMSDLNGDGLMDLIRSFQQGNEDPKTAAWLNTGARWVQADTYARFDRPAEGDDAKVTVAFARDDSTAVDTQLLDVNGDYISDIVHWQGSFGTGERQAFLNQSFRSNMLRLINDGTRMQIEFDYRTVGVGVDSRQMQDPTKEAYYTPAKPVKLDGLGRPDSNLLPAPPPVHAVERLLILEASGTEESDGGDDSAVASGSGPLAQRMLSGPLVASERSREMETADRGGIAAKIIGEQMQIQQRLMNAEAQANRGPVTKSAEGATDDGIVDQLSELRTTRALRLQYRHFRIDRLRGDPLGFGEIVRTNAASQTRKTTNYDQQFPLIGQVTNERIEQLIEPEADDQSAKWVPQSITVSKWKSSSTGSTVNGEATKLDRDRGPLEYHQVWLSESKSELFDPKGEPLGWQKDEFTPDGFGSTLRLKTTRSDGSSVTAESRYLTDEPSWLIGKLLWTRVERGNDSGERQLRISTFDYNRKTGRLTQETAFAGMPLAITRRHEYSDVGNRVATTTAAADINSRTERIEFDRLGRFQTAAISPLRQRSTTEYDEVSGRLKKQTDRGGRLSQFDYDPFGELAMHITSTGVETISRRKYLSPSVAAPAGSQSDARPNGATTLVSVQRGSLPPVERFTDAQGRIFREAVTGFSKDPADERRFFRDASYTVEKSLQQLSVPYDPKAPSVDGSQQPPSTVYDNAATGRIRHVQDARGNGTKFDYSGFRTTATTQSADGDRPERVRSRNYNLQRQLVSVINAEGGEIRYHYDVGGRLKEIIRPDDESIRYHYDDYGRLTKVEDGNRGTWLYKINSLGELVRRTDAKNQTTVFEYDRVGRLVCRQDANGISRWEWDSALNGVGRIHIISSSNGYREVFEYDKHGRTTARSVTVQGRRFTTRFQHDEYDRLRRITYPTGLAVRYRYDANGFLSDVVDVHKGTKYWVADDYDARGNVTAETIGNGAVITRLIDNATGHIREVKAESTSGVLFGRSYEYDSFGNVTQRTSAKTGLDSHQRVETFGYDGMDRLTRVSDGTSTIHVDYDHIGRMQFKSDVGNYRFGEQRGDGPVDAVMHIDRSSGVPLTYRYDANGNRESTSLGQRYSYFADNRMRRFDQPGGESNEFYHSPEGALYLQYHRHSGVCRTTMTIGIYEQQIDQLAGGHQHITHRHFIITPSGVCAIVTLPGGSQREPSQSIETWPRQVVYIHSDAIGSVCALSDEAGNLIASQHFDAWGRRVDHAIKSAEQFTRGFTGHRSLADSDLIHMEARVYDSETSQFTSTDPVMQSMTRVDNLNHFAYAWGNPLKYRDPTGMFLSDAVEGIGDAISGVADFVGDAWGEVKEHVLQPVGKFVKEYWKPIVVVAATAAVTAVTFGAAAPVVGTFAAGILTGAASGATAAGLTVALNGGNLRQTLQAMAKGAAIGALTGALMGAGAELALAADIGFAGEVLSNAVANGVLEEVQSGDFWLGFRTGLVRGLSDIDAIRGFDGDSWARIGAAAMSGGVMSEVRGGDFEDGAKSMAFKQVLRETPEFYEDVVGYNLDASPGGKHARKNEITKPVEGANNVGVQGGDYENPGLWDEGGPVSLGANQILSINAVAGFHDAMQVQLGTGFWRNTLNVPNMPIAAAITWAGFAGRNPNGAPLHDININVSGDRNNPDYVQIPSPPNGY